MLLFRFMLAVVSTSSDLSATNCLYFFPRWYLHMKIKGQIFLLATIAVAAILVAGIYIVDKYHREAVMKSCTVKSYVVTSPNITAIAEITDWHCSGFGTTFGMIVKIHTVGLYETTDTVFSYIPDGEGSPLLVKWIGPRILEIYAGNVQTIRSKKMRTGDVKIVYKLYGIGANG